MRRSILFLGLGLLLGASPGFSQTWIYYSNLNTSEIHRVNADGTGDLTVISASLGSSYFMALDPEGGNMYWTGTFPTSAVVWTAELDGDSPHNVVGGTSPIGIALDVAGDAIFWTDQGAQAIQRTTLDGTTTETVWSTAPSGYPQGIALDLVGGKMYWAELGSPPRIRRAYLNGTSVETLVSFGAGAGFPVGIALDVAGGKMYWTQRGFGAEGIRRANLDGTSSETVLSLSGDGPLGIALDTAAGKMYWTGNRGGLRRANLDGSGVQTVVGGVPTGAVAIEIVSTPIDFSGLLHLLVGDVEVTRDLLGDLVVSGFGTSGVDGLSLDLGEAEFGRIDLGPLDPLDPGAWLSVSATGTLDGNPDTTLSTLLMSGLGDGVTLLEADLSPVGIIAPMWIVYDGATVVFNGMAPDGVEVAGTLLPCFLPYQPAGTTGAAATVVLGGVHAITIPGGPTVLGDRIVIQDAPVTGSVDAVTSLELRGAGLESVTIEGEALGLFGVPHEALGDDALFDASSGQLTVSGLGPDLGGTSIGLAAIVDPDYGVALEPLVLTSGSDKVLRLEATGTVSGSPTTYGTLELASSGAGVDVIADYSSLGATMVAVEAFSGGALVGSAVVPAGLVGSLTGTSGPVIVTSGATSFVNPCMVVGFDAPVALTLAGGSLAPSSVSRFSAAALVLSTGSLVGDTFHFDGVGTTGTVDSLLGLSIQAANVGSFTLVGEGSPSPAQRIARLTALVSGLPGSAFRKKNDQKTLLNKLAEIGGDLAQGALCIANGKLHDLLLKVDGEPNPEDWVIDPVARGEMEGQVLALIAQLEASLPGGC